MWPNPHPRPNPNPCPNCNPTHPDRNTQYVDPQTQKSLGCGSVADHCRTNNCGACRNLQTFFRISTKCCASASTIKTIEVGFASFASFGGAVFGSGGVTIKHCHFKDLSANQMGGAVAADGDFLSVYESQFHSCVANTAVGGAIATYELFGDVKIHYCSFYDTHAVQAGGAIYVSNDQMKHLWSKDNSVTIHGCHFQYCTAEFVGGTVSVVGTSRFILNDTVISYVTSQYGAALGTTAVTSDAFNTTIASTSMVGGPVFPFLAWSGDLRLEGLSLTLPPSVP